MIVYDHHRQPQTEVPAHLQDCLPSIRHEVPDLFLITETIGKENPAEILRVSSLTSVFFWSSIYSCDNYSKIFARLASRSQLSL